MEKCYADVMFAKLLHAQHLYGFVKFGHNSCYPCEESYMKRIKSFEEMEYDETSYNQVVRNKQNSSINIPYIK
ncbi:hypothetical protein Anas_01015 [Armadillidium nasatum]|uniref:Uncharacterized protein n=1 Tax=Armadillidium nasatum TaxID=96803 RepID=A0A5N5SL35_9CRUS|nr:hypothetical protein Anas_01015 [Armadillidium nasatum]